MAKKDSNGNPFGQSRASKYFAGESPDWELIDGSNVVRAIAAASVTGGALRFGYSRDNAVYSVGVYGDGEPYTKYGRTAEELDIILKILETLFQDIASEQRLKRNGAQLP